MNQNSLAAYRRVGEFLEGHNFIIYEALLAGGAQTCWDISRTLFWNDYLLEDIDAAQIFRRMRYLELEGWVQRLDWVQDSPSGRACSVWWVR